MRKAILIISVLVLLAACDYPSQTETPDYFKGKEGLKMDFVERSPPSQVYEDSRFSVMIRVHNKGATDIPYLLSDYRLSDAGFETESGPARVSMNYDQFYLSRVEEQEELALELRGKSDVVPRGEERLFKIADMKARKVAGQRHSPETKLQVSVCYPYVTQLSTDVCMDASKQQRNLRDQVCRARDLQFSSGQGAPVAVSLIEVNMPPRGRFIAPTFVVHVENAGDGSVLRAYTAEDELADLCSLKSEREDVNTVAVYAELAGLELDCSPDPLRLAGDSAKAFCTVSDQEFERNPELFGRTDNFVTTLSVELHYLYTSGVSKRIEIQRRDSNLVPDSSQSGGCLSFQEEVDGRCVDKCSIENEGYSCSCTRDECTDLLGEDRCEVGVDVCAPGRYCCLETACSDFDNDRNDCTEAAIGCSYCEDTDECVESCTDCGYEYNETDGVCEAVE